MLAMVALVLSLAVRSEADQPGAQQVSLNCGPTGSDWSSLRPLGPHVAGKGNPYRVPEGSSLYGFRPHEMFGRSSREGDQFTIENVAVVRGVDYDSVVSRVLRHHGRSACDETSVHSCEIRFRAQEESYVDFPRLILLKRGEDISIVCSWVELDY